MGLRLQGTSGMPTSGEGAVLTAPFQVRTHTLQSLPKFISEMTAGVLPLKSQRPKGPSFIFLLLPRPAPKPGAPDQTANHR